MVLLDTNIFVIDRFFPRDPRYADNKNFVKSSSEIDAAFPLFSPVEFMVRLKAERKKERKKQER